MIGGHDPRGRRPGAGGAGQLCDLTQLLRDRESVDGAAWAVPPYAKKFMARAPQEEVEAWLDLTVPKSTLVEPAAYYRDLVRVRITGYHATTLDQAMSLRRILEQVQGLHGARELLDSIEAHVHERHDLSDEDSNPRLAAVMSVRAPIFGPAGRVVLALGMGQFRPDVSVEELQHYADQLMEGTRRVTEALHGSEPFPNWARPVEAGGMVRAVSA
jgi:DNA-binding IclR family transcriptional regulator